MNVQLAGLELFLDCPNFLKWLPCIVGSPKPRLNKWQVTRFYEKIFSLEIETVCENSKNKVSYLHSFVVPAVTAVPVTALSM